MAATPLSNSKPISSSRFKYIFLHEWWLAKQRKGLAVAGITSTNSSCTGEGEFLSSVIAKTHEPNVLETEDGITVILRGLINTSRTRENGFPSQVCCHFSCGFPLDWNKYTSLFFGDEHIDGTTGFGDSNDALPFSIHDHNLTKTKEVGSALGNFSKQLESNDIMECEISTECEYKDSTTSLKSSKSLVDMMANGENGLSEVAVELQAENPKCGQPFMGMVDHKPCTVISPNSSEKIRKDQLSSDCKEEQLIRRQKEAGDTFSRVVARSISKRSRTMLENGVSLPVRRSPRLHNRRK